jgi:arginine/lysine/ornithine decarboxylase
VTNIGDRVIVGRNCHKAVYNEVSVRNLQVEYIYPEYVPEFGINGGFQVEKLEKLFKEHKDVKAVILTSPTYDGVVSDIKSIAKITHKYGAVLIVDEAHGAHLCLSENLPESAYNCGADLVIESIHKTLPSLTQTALLHSCSDRVKTEKVERALSIYQSSSPSYVFMASIDRCINIMKQNGRENMEKMLVTVNKFRKNVNNLKFFRVPGKELVGKSQIFDVDITKLVICVHPKLCNGRQLAGILREKYGFEMEMEAPGYVLGITGICDREREIDRLADSLIEIEKTFLRENRVGNDVINAEVKYGERFELIKNQTVMSIYEAETSKTYPVKMEQSVGKISSEFLYLYPPGIPLLVPGEIISQELICQVREFQQMNMNINGLEDKKNRVINVIV